ncbi:hypothetical protein [Erwinia aphidicola]|uniref:hypothetical protein n=1 Tax=Erwinia aphidicola TaxID=68334 RepID=UPI0030182672
MEMFSRKKITKYILRFARYVPCIFPAGVVYFSKNHKMKNGEPYWSESDKKIKRISYFSGEFKWKAVTLSSVISKSDVLLLEGRLGKLKFSYPSEFFEGLSKTSIEDHGCSSHSIGVFNINREGKLDELGSFYLESQYFSSVFISLFKSSSGLFILTYYFFMDGKATDLIKDVNVANLNPYQEFVGINIYRNKNRALKSIDRKSQSLTQIENNFSKVVDEAKMVVKYIGEKLGVKPYDFLIGSEYYKDQDEPYFNRNYMSESSCGEEIFYMSSSNNNELNYSENPSEHFFNGLFFRRSIFDISYLTCANKDSYEPYDCYLNKYYRCYESHLAFIPLYVVHRQISYLVEKLTDVFSPENSSNLAKHHDFVYRCLSQAETINKWINEIESDYRYSCDEKYHGAMSNIIARQKKRLAELLVSTKTFYSLSENRVQVENIKYNKRYSRLVFFLVIIQILLAAMTIDFLKKEQWYTPIIVFFTSLYHKF